MKILIYRLGQFGDLLISLPAIWAIKAAFPGARLTLMADHHVHRRYIAARDVFGESGIVDDYLHYELTEKSGDGRPSIMSAIRLLRELRRRRFDVVAYLPPSYRTDGQIRRDRVFFGLARVGRVIGMHGFPEWRSRPYVREEVPREADNLLRRLAADGIPVPRPGHGRMDLALGAKEEEEFTRWRGSLSEDGGRPWLALCVGAKASSKKWPEDRYERVVQRLISEFDLWPVLFGGGEDGESADRLIRGWGRGHNAAGHLSIRAAGLGLKRCRLYFGNDTGTMHLATTVGVRCVAVFSARAVAGLWYPYGEGHTVIRREVPCAGCRLEDCPEPGHPCISGIEEDEVYRAVADAWKR